MNPRQKPALIENLLALADDEMILAHRNSEWAGHGPILEEDIAFTNIALDEMGHAAIWYRLIAQLEGEDAERYPDTLVFHRPAEDFRNTQLVELPNGDWAFSMLRQYLFDSAEMIRLAHLVNSDYAPLREAAIKIQREEIYHHRHTSAWVRRLGLGTEESQARTQRALDELWEYALQLFEPTSALAEIEFMPDNAALRDEWEAHVKSHLAPAQLTTPQDGAAAANVRSDHTAHLADLVVEMQEVARLETNVNW